MDKNVLLYDNDMSDIYEKYIYTWEQLKIDGYIYNS